MESILALADRRRLRCRACGEPVTSEDQRVEIEGRHVHRRTNPAGFEFELGCFRQAVGTVGVGVPTLEHTWFAGFTWRYSICRGCSSHLGWLFEGPAPSFHGLILDRLVPEGQQA